MSKAPRTPHPPDPDAERVDDLVDRVVEDEDWANRREARFSARRLELVQVRLTGAQLADGALIDVVFADCRADLTSFRFAKLERVVFRDCRLNECDFYGATLTDVLFERCDLREAVFSGAKLERVELQGCELTGLHGVEALRGVRMPLTDVLANALLFASALEVDVLED
jgi:uncharacterized protein YjbI with pentapeptide repeats